MSISSPFVVLSLDDAYELSFGALLRNGLDERHAAAVARSVVSGQRDECHSHGLYRLLVCVKGLRTGKINGNANPEVFDMSAALTRVDAHGGFSQVAFDVGAEHLVRKAKEVGIAALAINNCFHFSALWQEVEQLAELGVAAMAMTPSHSYVAPAGGNKPLLGTNPFAFGWPRPGKFPFVFDFATSMVARGDIELAKRKKEKIPFGWAVDQDGMPTDDPGRALEGAMLTFGSYKGSALSTMIELLAGPLLGDLMSFESQQVDAGAAITPFHGELLVAFSPQGFVGSKDGATANHERAESLFNAIVDQGARLPSQRRFEARAKAIREGVRIDRALYEDIRKL
ncbi:Ldh family oxidoreductase [Paraburkholderia susongensis]|uniref:Malate/lactate/ureidoglycolate dehydrogenase, LDH2 family n=1 Tax=Paraburkholderia susongensis TaxID=1515439 RepID=A0A1X7LIL7_9BURK|nr:Ldh family oxidoreductase [Paraburkholderia susongensis]SMG53500.1 Malate/lactate/ureidoglycolate dehydrogenase, LDH2 family [Paraburkholderia susongensis]